MDLRRNRNWTNVQAAYQINRNYTDRYPSIRMQDARNAWQINVKQYEDNSYPRNQPDSNHLHKDKGANRGRTENQSSVLKQFYQETTFHGFIYLGEKNRSKLERAFWIIVLAFFYYESVQLLIHGYRMFNTRTVIINIDGSPPLVSDIPFPAFTVCSSNLLTKSGLARVERNEALRGYKDDILSQLCQVYRNGEEVDENSRNFINSSIFTNFLLEVGAMNCSKIIREQFWLSSLQTDPCHNMQKIMTFFGICYTFNLLPLSELFTDSFYYNHVRHQMNITDDETNSLLKRDKQKIDWTPERGYKQSANLSNVNKEKPYRTTGVSIVHSLLIHTDILDEDFDKTCNRGTRGFFFIVHNPAELPGLSHPASFVGADRSAIVKVKTTTHKLDKRLISWKPEERKCYLEKERKLMFYRYYTEENCRFECQANFTLIICGCVPIFLPHLLTTPVCGPEKRTCHKTLWTKISPLQATKICKCLPSCTELSFNMDFTNAEKNRSHTLVSKKVMGPGTTKFQIFYKDKVISSYRRLLLFDWNDGVALLGGIMCLFCGGSFLSFFELINFFVFRVIKPKKIEDENEFKNEKISGKY